MNRLRGDATEEQIKLQRFDANLASKYNVSGLRYRFNLDTGEIEITPDAIDYTLEESLKAVAMLSIEWEGVNDEKDPS
jgi:hypothetical protein